MLKKLPVLLCTLICTGFIYAQEHYQYFDGADTMSYSLQIEIDTSYNENIWQIGEPQKALFDSAYSPPNVIMTDTINFYPINNESSFQFTIIDPSIYGAGIFAVQWMQKLDMDPGTDGGVVEFSVDNGLTWENAFISPYIYNFYGHDPSNENVTYDGTPCFSGQDSTWRDIWLCIDNSYLDLFDTVTFRYTIYTDDEDNSREGWMMDNFRAHITWVHTINENPQTEYLRAYPNPTEDGLVQIEAKKTQDFHIIEYMAVMDMEGKVLKEYEMVPTKFRIDIGDLPKGNYLLTVQTNLKTETFKIVHGQ